MLDFPAYRLDPSRVFPETRGMRVKDVLRSQSSLECQREASVLVLAAAFCKTGGPPNDLSMSQFLAELTHACDLINVPVSRVLDWTDSVLLDPMVTLTAEEAKAVPRRSITKGFDLHQYQLEIAAWCARRLGSVLALGCGVGKTLTAVHSVITAVRIGRCSNERLFIIAPVNAMVPWQPYLPELKTHFKEVQIVSVDSLHHYKGLESAPGGAIILDEVHKVKADDAARAREAHHLRRCFEWGIALTGTMLHSGPEGVIGMLDAACPGLSRFYDKWTFGEAFNCIAKQKVKAIGKIKQKLIIPGDDARPYLAEYLRRGTRSLSFASPEVAACVNLPGQTKTQIDTWEMPEWVKAYMEAHPTPKDSKFPTVMWGPEAPWEMLLGGLAVAIMEETRDEIRETAAMFTHTELKDLDACVAVLKGALDDPLIIVEDRKRVEFLIKNAGLPHESRAMFEACRVGRFDRVIALTNNTWRFVYPEGASRKKQAPGPKLLFVKNWLLENPTEPLVVGAAGRQTVDALARMLDEMGITYRTIRGGVPVKDRIEFVNGFAAEEFRVMLLQQVAGSESVDLVRASTSMLVDHDWGPIAYTQYLARTCRQGQKRYCEHYDLTFGAIQTEVLTRLIRGESFDAKTRESLEKQAVYVSAF